MIDTAPTINSLDFIQGRVDNCVAANGELGPLSFLYVDHWSIGDALEFANEYNKKLGSS